MHSPHPLLASCLLALALASAGAVACPACTDTILLDGFDPLAPGGDADGDGLANGVETGTGVYLGPGDTGTNPHDSDTDGDGLADGDEVHGTPAGLNLAALGASPVHRDILIEYDWLEDDTGGHHSHRPTQAMLDSIALAYARAPLANPDGTTGIHVVQDMGQGGALSGGSLIPDLVGGGVIPDLMDGGTYQAYEAAHFAANRRGYFHYTIMIHQYGATQGSGASIQGGYEILVSLGTYHANLAYVRNTLIHELGHNLGLMHGGVDGCNGKPNYNSLMNYRYHFPGIDSDGSCDAQGDGLPDYSRGRRLALDEHHLDETRGVCGTRGIDWNGNGLLQQDVAVDINPPSVGGCPPALTRLVDFDDWAAVRLDGVRTGLRQAMGRWPDRKTVVECEGPPTR